ncbi:acyl-CoA carboxylase subunit epsilon [Streptomyces sp. NPDC001139]
MTDDHAPLLRIKRGSPTAEELAALTAVLSIWALAAVPVPRSASATVRRSMSSRCCSYVSPFSWRTAI